MYSFHIGFVTSTDTIENQGMILFRSIYVVIKIMFVIEFIPRISATICPVSPPCHCQSNPGGRAYCNNLNLTKIPVLNKSGGTWIIDFSNNNITTIKSGAFKNVQLEQLYLSNNSIQYIDDDAFAGSEKTIDVLRFDGNQLQKLPTAFTNLPNIIGINVQYNPMPDLNVDILTNLSKSLVGISFGSATMTSWPTSLQKLNNLLMLSIYGLPLKMFPESAFLGFEKTLNFLEVIDTKFANLPLTMKKLINLNYVNIKNNAYLTAIHEESFKGLPNITTLTIQNNALTSIPAIFKDSDKMYQVTVTSEHITDVTESLYASRSQPRFNYLTLTDTDLEAVPAAISNMPALTVVTFQGGHISVVRSSDFYNMPALANIVLTKNPLKIIEKEAFRNLPSLRYLSLDSTKLTTVPEAIRNTNVSWINLDNTAVQCACSSLKWMKTWPMRLNTTIKGTCANIHMLIEDFKNDDIPNC